MDILLNEFILLFHNIANKKINEIKEIIEHNFNTTNLLLEIILIFIKVSIFHPNKYICTGLF